MKRITAIVMAVVMAAGMLLMTACESGMMGSAKVSQASAGSVETEDLSSGYVHKSLEEDEPCPLEIRRALARLSLDMFQKTAIYGENKNVLISPDSLMVSLAMVENGAKGKTLEEIQNATSGVSSNDFNEALAALNDRLMSAEVPVFTSANSIWVKGGSMKVRDDFVQKNKELHDASLFAAPFDGSTVKDMNEWIAENTNGKIKDAVNGLEPHDVMVLINAVAFDGKWKDPFEEGQLNKKGSFTTEDGKKQKCTMMNDSEDVFIELNGGTGFVKPYKGEETVFVGILPPEGMSLDDYIARLNGDDFLDAWDNRDRCAVVDLSIPKFEYEYEQDMNNVLQDLGIKTAFSQEADFTGINEPVPHIPPLSINKVFHKAHITVDEDGTKAEAATITSLRYMARPRQNVKTVKLDRPFVYAIVDVNTGMPLFIGAVRTMK